jgi:serine/threonine protein phosphatase PrpC
MRPILDPNALPPGAVLYHSAFGFARVRDVHGDGVELEWDREGTHLPARVRFDNLTRVYTRCTPDGFFDRAFREPARLRDTLHTRPADALVWLLDDLDAPQRLRDVMDWLIGRKLFTAKTFVRWWGTAEALVKADHRLSWEGGWVRRVQPDTTADGTKLTQLEPGLVEVEPEGTHEETDGTIPPDDYDEDDERLTTTGELRLPTPIALGEAAPPPASLPAVGHALAHALAAVHAEGRLAHPDLLNTVLLPDGTVLLDQGQSSPPARGEPPSRASDLYAAASVLVEAFVGRPLPPLAEPSDLLPHLRHQLPTLAPSALGPLFGALHPDPERRPSAEVWLHQWRAVLRAEAERESTEDASQELRVGYDSHVGRVKLMQTQTNQDALYLATRGHRRILMLCDGISVADAGRGDLASRLATQAVGRLWEHVSPDKVGARRLLDRALHLANRAVCERALKIAHGDLSNRMPMGTTIVVAATEGNRVHLAWLGDSRAYLVGDYGAALLTADDNVSGERFVAWCARQIRSWSAQGHALVRYLGHFDEDLKTPAPFPAHHTSLVLRPGERLVLCTDGITDYIDAHEPGVALSVEACARILDPNEACRALVNLANHRGGGDNASAIVVQVAEPERDDVIAW